MYLVVVYDHYNIGMLMYHRDSPRNLYDCIITIDVARGSRLIARIMRSV